VAAAKRAWGWGLSEIDGGRGSGAKQGAEKRVDTGSNRKIGFAGAEARAILLALSARLKSCPVTKRSRIGSNVSFSAACKALVDFAALAARDPDPEGAPVPRSCPFKARTPFGDIQLLAYDDAALHDEADVLDGGDVVEGIAGDGDYVGVEAGL